MKSLKTYFALLSCAALLLGSCNKIENPQSNDPVFKIDGTIDGEPIELNAGLDNAFMFTSIEQDNNVDVFTGRLSNGDLGIEISIFDGLVDIPTHQVLSSLPEELVFSRRSNVALAVLSKNLFPNASLIEEVVWIIDGSVAGVNNAEITKPGVYDVCAEITFTDATTENLCSELIVGYQRHANCQIKHFLNQNGTLTAWVEDPQVEIEKVLWFLDDVLIGESPDLSTQLGSAHYNLRADVYFENGVIRSKNMLVDGSLSGKFIDDLTFFETGTLSLLNRDFNVRVKLEQNGTVFTSDLTNNSMNTVSLANIKYYGLDAAGNSVYKVKAHIVATVIDEQGTAGSRNLDFETEFGIAIRND